MTPPGLLRPAGHDPAKVFAQRRDAGKAVGSLLWCARMPTSPPTQYADDRNLRARQRIWSYQQPPFDLIAWVAGLLGLDPGAKVLDVGCGNGAYLRELSASGAWGVGCDQSAGMLAGSAYGTRVVGDAEALPFPAAAFDAVLAAHMLYHVQDRPRAVREFHRVLVPEGVCVAVTNGARFMESVRDLVEEAVHRTLPGWEMRNPSVHVFSLENGAEQLAAGFSSVSLVRPEAVGAVIVTDASVVADYVASVGDIYGPEVDQPWAAVVEHVRSSVETIIANDGQFVTSGDTGAFICRA